MRPIQLVISSEHSGNEIPETFNKVFSKAGKALNSHRGIDFGSSFLAKNLSEAFNAELFETHISRLLVDCNRSLQRADLFSEFSAGLNQDTKREILENYYFPHRKRVEKFISEHSETSLILHLSIHTFTPVWNGVERSVDVGLLFDEARSSETILCTFWKEELQRMIPSKKIEHNRPYTGTDDGLTAHLRKIFPNNDYMGIEIEVNQKYADTGQMEKICRAIITSLHTSIQKMKSTLNDSEEKS